MTAQRRPSAPSDEAFRRAASDLVGRVTAIAEGAGFPADMVVQPTSPVMLVDDGAFVEVQLFVPDRKARE